MSMVWPSLRAVFRICAACLGFGLALGGCKRRPPAPAPASAPSAVISAVSSSAPEPEEMTRCRRLADFGLTLEADALPAKSAEPSDEEDDDALLPFGIDVGAAVATPFGFAASGLRGTGQAFVALLSEHASHRIDLGELHGDAETPALAVAGAGVVVALRSTDAAGFTLKLGSIAGAGSAEVSWGYELSKLGKTVTGVELATLGSTGVLVYQGEEKGGATRLMLGAFATDNLKEPFEVKPLEPKDVELPRLAARPGGYWLSWVRTLSEPKKAAKAPPGAAKDAGPAEDPEEREILQEGLRVVEVAKLDEQGKLLGAPRRIGEPRRQVLLYDVASLASGNLLVAVRADSATPGAEGGALSMSELQPDGSVHEERLDDDDIGAGAPALLVDVDPKLPGPWLSMSGSSDATRLGLAQGEHSALQADPLLGHAEVIAVSGGHFLLQRARGRGVVLEALDCSWPPSDAAAEKK
jgi:hypothetical protein